VVNDNSYHGGEKSASMTYDAAELEAFAATLFETTGASESTAAKVANSLVESDLRGHHSHGTLRVPLYARKVEKGILDPTAEATVNRDDGATVHLDGNDAFGQVVGRQAVDIVTERAADHGVAVCGMCESTHLGRMGEWAERVADEGLIFASFTNSGGGSHTVAPAGTADRKLSTNPVAFGVPTFDALPFDVVLDMATSQVAHGKIRERYATGEPIPEGWTTSDDGTPHTDPHSFGEGEGAIMPLGGDVSGYKGFGLSVIVELVAGIVGDGLVAGEVDREESENNSAFVAIDPERFTDRAGIERRVAALAAHLRDADYESGPSPGVAARGVGKLPGEPEYEKREKYGEEGIPMDDRVLDSLREMAEERGVPVEI
jgi:uncharacterized oxidoreductase